MTEQSAKSIRVVVVDENGFTWHLDCSEVAMKSLVGDQVVIKGATVKIDGVAK